MHFHYGSLEKIIDQKFVHYNENIIDVQSAKNIKKIIKYSNNIYFM